MTASEWLAACPVGERRSAVVDGDVRAVDRRTLHIRQEGGGAKMWIGSDGASVVNDDPPEDVLHACGWRRRGKGTWMHPEHGVSVEIDDGAAFFYAFDRSRAVHGVAPKQLRAFAALAAASEVTP